MLDEMIAVSKLESGRIALDLQPISLQQVFEDLERLTALLAANRNITLNFRSPSPEIVVIADFQRLCHALVLLVDMAIASFERVTLRIAAETPDENTVTITIEIPGSLPLTPERPTVTPDADLEEIERWERSLSLSPELKFDIARSIIDLLNGRVDYREIPAGDDGEKITRIDCSVPRSPVAIAVPTDND